MQPNTNKAEIKLLLALRTKDFVHWWNHFQVKDIYYQIIKEKFKLTSNQQEHNDFCVFDDPDNCICDDHREQWIVCVNEESTIKVQKLGNSRLLFDQQYFEVHFDQDVRISNVQVKQLIMENRLINGWSRVKVWCQELDINQYDIQSNYSDLLN